MSGHSRHRKEGIVLVMDFGKSMARKCFKSDKTVFEASKQCLENIIRQKIFAETKNEYLLVEFSTESTERNGISVNRYLCSPNVDLLRYLATRNQSTDNRETNVIDALNEAIIEFLNQSRYQTFQDLKIALFTDFGNLNHSDVNRFWDEIYPRLTTHDIQLIVVSDLNPNSDSGHDFTKSQVLALKLLKDIEDKSIGFCYDLESAIKQFSQFEGRKSSPNAWYSSITLGRGVNSLTIPVGAFIKVETYKKKTATEAYVRPVVSDSNTLMETNTDSNELENTNIELLDTKPDLVDIKSQLQEIPIEKSITFKPKNDESFEELEKEDVIRGYAFGQTIVPFTEDDKKLFAYNNNEKGFKIIGFTSLANINFTERVGKKTYFVFPDPRPKQHNHKLIFQCLVNALIDSRKVAIVRYNWSDRSNPQIGYLLPHIEDNNVLFAYNQLPFEEDIRKYRFPSLEKNTNYSPTEPQLEAIDNLIDSMDLMTAGIDNDGNQCEALESDEISDPRLQHWFYCLYHRSIKGLEEDLPEINDYLKDLIETPKEITEKALYSLEQLKQNFSLEEKTSKKRSKSMSNSSQITNCLETDPKRARISDEIIGIESIKYEMNDMIETKAPMKAISDRFNDSMKGYFADNSKLETMGDHIIEMIELFRKESVENNDPKYFNDFLLKFKQTFFETNIWYLLLAQEIRLIGQMESSNSDVSQEMVENYTNLSDNQIKIEDQ